MILYFLSRKFGETGEIVEHLMGKTHITELLCGLLFQISPLAFFQINTSAAELLYNSVKSLCKLTPETTLLDICCGTGTIGLSLSKVDTIYCLINFAPLIYVGLVFPSNFLIQNLFLS